MPVSVSVVSGELIAKQGLASTADLQRIVPGIVLVSGGPIVNTQFSIRGQGKDVTGAGLPSVITYFNEVPLPSMGSFTPLFDISNVQVLKGPQGTLFGRNTTGGALLEYSTRPGYELGGYVQVDVGNYRKHAIQGAINVPIIADRLALRIAGDIERQRGFSKNASTGGRQDNTHSDAIRVSLLAEPFDNVENVTVFDYMESKTNGLAQYPFNPFTPELAAAIAEVRALGKRTVVSRFAPHEDVRLWGVSNTTTIDFGGATLKNIFGYRNVHTDLEQNSDALVNAPLPNLGPDVAALGYVPGQPGVLLAVDVVFERVQYSDELQLGGAAFDDKLNWLVGAFYLNSPPVGQNWNVLDLFRPTPPSATTSFIVDNFLGGVWPIGSLVDTRYGDKSKAVFGNLSYDLGGLFPAADGLKLNAGYRRTWDTESVCGTGRAVIALTTGRSLVTPFQSRKECETNPASFVSSADFSAGTYTLGLDYTVSDDVFLYFTTRRGYRAGGLNSPALAPALAEFQTFDPQKVTDYEVGTHTRWELGQIKGRFNLAAFKADFSDYQLQATGINAASGIPGLTAENQPTNSALTVNAGKAKSKGVELDGVIAPFPALSINYAVTYLQQKLGSISTAPILAPFLTPGGHFSGSPKWSYQFGGQYRIPLGDGIGNLSLEGDYYHLGSQFQGTVRLPSYGLLGLRANWSNMLGRPIDLTLYVDNVTDKQYYSNLSLSTDSFGLNTGSLGAPRTFGARLRYNF